MSTLKVNTLDTRSGTDITVTTGKTVVIPAGATISVAGTQTVTGAQTNTGTLDISGATVTLPTTLPATIGTNITQLPGANITGTIPAAALGNVDLTGIEADIALLAFKTQANGSLARYNLVDQSVDAFEDASGINAPASSDAYRNAAGKFYSGAALVTSTGGTQSTYGDYVVHKFLTTGNYQIDAAINHDILVVGGGGGGNGDDGGAGGAGGVRVMTGRAMTINTAYTMTVGTGGAGKNSGSGNQGVNSVAVTAGGNVTARGGGGGGAEGSTGGTGGSGGGGGGVSGHAGGAGNQGGQSPVEGYPGGAGSSSGSNYGGGSGGGAGAPGGDGGSTSTAPGGDGIQNDYLTGSNIWYGGGGGGTGRNAAGSGGQGGGGAGSVANNPATPGTDGLGGGGGGSGEGGGGGPGFPGGDGGDGVVIVRYSLAGGVFSDMTLVSNTTTTATAPTKGDLVFTYTNGTGTAVVGTNITADYSADGGSTWTDFGIAAGDVQGTTGGHTIVTKNNVSLTSTSGTNMRFRIKTLVQSAALETRIHAVSLGWS